MPDNSEHNHQAGSTRGDAIIVDFDYVMIDGYEILELAAENAYGAHNVELTRGLFLRKLLGSRATPNLSSLLPAGLEITPEKFTSQVYEAADKAVDGAPFRKAVFDYVKKAEKDGAKIIFITSRNQAVVEQKLEGAGIPEPRVVRVDKGEIFGNYNHEAWNKAMRFAYPVTGSSLLLVGGAQSVRDALGMGRRSVTTTDADGECVILPSIMVSRIVAIVPPLLEYQDFTGADFVFYAQPDAELAKSLAAVS